MGHHQQWENGRLGDPLGSAVAVQVEVDSSQVPVTYGMMQVALIHGHRWGSCGERINLLVAGDQPMLSPVEKTPLISWYKMV